MRYQIRIYRGLWKAGYPFPSHLADAISSLPKDGRAIGTTFMTGTEDGHMDVRLVTIEGDPVEIQQVWEAVEELRKRPPEITGNRLAKTIAWLLGTA